VSTAGLLILFRILFGLSVLLTVWGGYLAFRTPKDGQGPDPGFVLATGIVCVFIVALTARTFLGTEP
jgi:hypothetical protein